MEAIPKPLIPKQTTTNATMQHFLLCCFSNRLFTTMDGAIQWAWGGVLFGQKGQKLSSQEREACLMDLKLNRIQWFRTFESNNWLIEFKCGSVRSFWSLLQLDSKVFSYKSKLWSGNCILLLAYNGRSLLDAINKDVSDLVLLFIISGFWNLRFPVLPGHLVWALIKEEQ